MPRALPAVRREGCAYLHDHIGCDGRAPLCRPQVWRRQGSDQRAKQTPRSSSWQILGALRYLHGAHMHELAGSVRVGCRILLLKRLKAATCGPQMARNTLTWPVVSFTWARCNANAVTLEVFTAAYISVHGTGIGVASTGHCHPKVVKAIQDQASDFIIAQQNIFTSSPAMVRLHVCMHQATI